MKMDGPLLESSPFHNPRLHLNDQNKQQKIYELVKDFVLPVSKLSKFIELFTEEMRLGLVTNPLRKSLFYMCNTFVTDHPDGTEEGDFLSLDLGGTNLRIYLVRLKPGTEPEFRSKHYEIEAKYRNGTGEQLFDFLADCLKDFIDRNPDIGGKRLPFGFIIPAACDQKALDKAIMTQFSTMTDIPDAVGKDAVDLFRDAISKKGLTIDILAIAADTTSTLAYGMYLKPDTQISFIMGSGTNTAYLERVDRIEHMNPTETFGKTVERVIINMESSFFGDDGAIDFVKTKFDKELDEESLFPNSNGLDKMRGGSFIGDLVRRVLLCLVQNDILLSGLITEQLKQKDAIKGPDVSIVESESVDGQVVLLLNRLGYSLQQITSDDIAIVRYVCALVSVRVALLSVADIGAVVQHIGRPLVRVAVDGSLYRKHPKMHTLMSDFIAELVPNQKVELFLADEGSGKGSAFIAAVANKLKQNQ